MATDNFNRANEIPLAAPWVMIGTSKTFSIQSNQLRGHTATGDAYAYYSGAASGAAQFAEFTVVQNANSNDYGPAVRVSGGDTTQNGYFFEANPLGGTGYLIGRHVNGVYQDVATATGGTTPVAGDVLRIEVNGSTIKGYVNGVLKITGTDSSLTTGQPGLFDYDLNAIVDNWNGGDLGTASSSAYGARITGQSSSTDSRLVRITGQLTSSLANDVRIQGTATSSQSYDSRIVGQLSSSQVQEIRIVGDSGVPRAARIYQVEFEIPQTATVNRVTDVRIQGTAQSSQAYDVRTIGSATSAYRSATVTNLLSNGGAELNTTAWSQNNGGETITRDTSTVIGSGIASLRVVCDGTAASQGALQVTPVNTVVPNQPLTASFLFLGIPGNDYRVELVYRNSAAAAVTVNSIQTITFTATGTIQYITLTHTGSSDAAINRASIKIRVPGVIVRSDQFWLDDVQIETTQAGSPWPYINTQGTTATQTFTLGQDVRITGQNTSSDLRDVRVTGQFTSSLANDVRIIGTATSSNAQNARVTGQLTTSLATDVRLVGSPNANLVLYDVRVIGQATASAAIDARIIGQVTSSLAINTRVTAQAVSSQVYASRITGQLINNQAYDVRTTGLIGVSYSQNVALQAQSTSTYTSDVRVTSQLQTQVARDVRVTGQSISSLATATEVVGAALANARYDVRLFAEGKGVYSQGVRLVGGLLASAAYGIRFFAVARSSLAISVTIFGLESPRPHPMVASGGIRRTHGDTEIRPGANVSHVEATRGSTAIESPGTAGLDLKQGECKIT